MSKIAPSLLSADFTCLRDEMKRFADSGAKILHLDVMDGHFVPNMTFGWSLISKLRPLLPDVCFDVHLMISEPLRWIDEFCNAGADMVTVHTECQSDVSECIKEIKRQGKVAGVSIKPNTPAADAFPYLDEAGLVLIMTVEPGFGGQKMIPECLAKAAEIRAEAERRGNTSLIIAADGGVNEQNCRMVADAGIDIIVAGNAVFGAENMEEAYRRLSGMVE